MNETLRTKIADQFRNTPLGFSRIKRNLDITLSSDGEIEKTLRKVILSTPLNNVETKGKNYYFKCFEYNSVLTINSQTLTIITAKKIIKNDPVSKGKIINKRIC